jgi:hypothetical protein
VQRWASTLVGVAAVLLAVWLVARDFKAPKGLGHDPNATSEDGGALAAAEIDAGHAVPAAEGGSLFVGDLPVTETRGEPREGAMMPDGTSVPPLPVDTPRQVRFGVVLVSYQGAQPSVTGINEAHPLRPATRSKADAQQLAAKLAATAQQDFHAAVQQGDAGSSDDVGRVKVGILEPAPEYVLFTARVGSVAGPVDTPRGFWIVKRLE